MFVSVNSCIHFMAPLQGPSSQWVDVMKNKRAIHEKVIQSVQQQRKDNPSEELEVQGYVDVLFHFCLEYSRNRMYQLWMLNLCLSKKNFIN